LNVKGKIRLSTEGINGTLEGCQCSIDSYIKKTTKSKAFGEFKPEDFKYSSGTGLSFDDLVVSICDELCTIGISPTELDHTEGGKYLTPEEFHDVLEGIQILNKTNGSNENKVNTFAFCSF